MKRHIGVCITMLVGATIVVAGSAGTSEAGLFDCCGWLHGLFHHHRAPACDPCGPAGYPAAVSSYYGPRTQFASYGSFYAPYSAAYYGPSHYAPAQVSYGSYDPCAPCQPLVSSCNPCGPICGPGPCAPCGPGGACPGGPSSNCEIPARGRTPDEPPPYDVPNGAGPERTFREPDRSLSPAAPADDAFRGREPAAPPADGSLDRPEAGATDAFRPEVPDVRSPDVRPPLDEPEPVPQRPAAPPDARDVSGANEAEDANDRDPGDSDGPAAIPSSAPPAAPPLRLDDRNVAWRSIPAATRTALHVTYTMPEPVRGKARVNDGWTPKARSPQFARN
ncbi:MAG: hypothetical protein WD069_06535 [Planctomycetales bacterium]